MSCREYEYGTLKLSASDFNILRKIFSENEKKHQENLYLKAVSLQDCIKNFVKTHKKEFKSSSSMMSHITEFLYNSLYEDFSYTDIYKMQFSIVKSIKDEKGHDKLKFSRPKKIDFKFSKQQSFLFENEYCSVLFNERDNTVSWDVMEGNHAIEEARKSRVGKIFWKNIKNIEWKRGTGGCIYSNNEYNQEVKGYEGAGGDLISFTFGPLKK